MSGCVLKSQTSKPRTASLFSDFDLTRCFPESILSCPAGIVLVSRLSFGVASQAALFREVCFEKAIGIGVVEMTAMR